MSMFSDPKMQELEQTCARIMLDELLNGSVRKGIRQVILEVLHFAKDQATTDKK